MQVNGWWGAESPYTAVHHILTLGVLSITDCVDFVGHRTRTPLASDCMSGRARVERFWGIMEDIIGPVVGENPTGVERLWR